MFWKDVLRHHAQALPYMNVKLLYHHDTAKALDAIEGDKFPAVLVSKRQKRPTYPHVFRIALKLNALIPSSREQV